jgi:hypothetical protein
MKQKQAYIQPRDCAQDKVPVNSLSTEGGSQHRDDVTWIRASGAWLQLPTNYSVDWFVTSTMPGRGQAQLPAPKSDLPALKMQLRSQLGLRWPLLAS